MIICCYTSINCNWTDAELATYLAQIPQGMAATILKKRAMRDKQLSTAGKLLLMEVLSKFDLNLSLHDMKLDAYHRPYFDADIDFNISHSGNIVVCCGTKNGRVGIDVEEVYHVNVHDYDSYFTPKEWAVIKGANNQTDMFFKFWTRKEAVLKAIGTGFSTPLQAVEVIEDDAKYKGKVYHLLEVETEQGYQCQVASTLKQEVKVYKTTI